MTAASLLIAALLIQAPTLIKPNEEKNSRVAMPPKKAARQEDVKVQSPESSDGSVSPCLIVKHKGTLGRRLIWFTLIGVPMAPGTKFDYVESFNFQDAKMSYKAKDLEKLSELRVRIIVIKKDYTADEVRDARAECRKL